MQPGKKELIRILCQTTYLAYKLSLISSKAANEQFVKFKNIEIGDIVMEISSFSLTRNWIDAIGYLIKIEKDLYLLKRLFNNKIIRWSNCSFIRVPNGKNFFKPLDRNN